MGENIEQRLARIIERSLDFVGMSDLSGRVLYINAAGLKMLGFPADHRFLETTVADYLPDSAFKLLSSVGIGVAMRDGGWRGETTMRHADGSEVPVSMLVTAHPGKAGAIEFLSTVAHDISEEKRLLRALEESKARFEVIARATSDAVWDWNLATDALLWNESFGTIFGYEPQDVSATLGWWAERLHLEDRARVLQTLQSALRPGSAPYQSEYRFRKADGRWAWVMAHGIVVRDATGRAVRMIGAMSDMTERKEMQSRLLLADRMASLGTLAAGVAHEINNPLAYVLSNLAWVQDALSRGSGPFGEAQLARLRQTVGDARHGAERVREIVRDLKAFSRVGDPAKAPVDVQRVLESAISLVKAQVQPRAQLVREYRDVPPVLGNEGRLCQVFVNLLVNAAQAIPEGKPHQHEIRVATRRGSAGQIIVDVSDTGGGIPSDVLNNIFDPFFTTKPVGVGTGLGLAVCHGIVTSLGGDIRVNSRMGEGSTFTVVLPAAPPMQAEHPTPPPVLPLEARRRILIVDDERNFLVSLRLLLQPDHDVTMSDSAEDALAKMEAGAQFDLILCDLMMPGMTGMDLHERVVGRDPRVAERMVFLTGGAFTPRARQFLDSCTNPQLEKPIELEELRRLIARYEPWPVAA